jgi:Tfp pilus assembly protein PilN
MKLINLLPKSENRELKLTLLGQQLINFWIYVSLSLVVFFVLALAVNVFLRSEITKNNHEIESKKQELASSNTQQLEARVQALNNQIRAIDSLQENHYNWSQVMLELSRVTPEDVRLNLVNFERSTGKVEVTGNGATRDAVIEFWANVKKSKYFRNINFPFSNLEKDKNAQFEYSFYVNFDSIKNDSDN